MKIADFLGGSYRAQLLANGKELLNAITHKADIKTMKGNVKHIVSYIYFVQSSSYLPAAVFNRLFPSVVADVDETSGTFTFYAKGGDR